MGTEGREGREGTGRQREGIPRKSQGILDYRAYGSGADPGSLQLAYR